MEMLQGYLRFFVQKPRALPRAFRGVIDRAILKKPHLRVAEVAITFVCNSRCIMCSCSKFLNKEKERTRLTPDDYRKLGGQLDGLGCVSMNITGGEPLTRPDALEIIEAVNPGNKIVNLITNGINLTPDAVTRCRELGVDSIVVSLESTDPAENDRIRGFPGHFEIVMRAMEQARLNGMRFGVSLTLGDFNFRKVQEMIAFAKEKKVFLCIAHGGSIGNWAGHEDIFLSPENAKQILGLVAKHKEMKIDFSANLSLRPGCPAIVEKIYVTPYGDILPCTFNPISFGNIREEPLAAIWNRMVDFHRREKLGGTLCMRTYDRDYIDKFLKPIQDLPQPVPISEHPAERKE